jgi:two-component system KDP operon response regulator KdpE
VVEHSRLLEAVWGLRRRATRHLRVFIGQLRKKVEADPSAPRH